MFNHYKERATTFLATQPQKAKLIAFITLALMLPLTIAAALTVQNLQQKASGSEYIRIVDDQGATLSTTTNSNVRLQITLPPEWALPAPDGAFLPVIKKVYAQSNTSQPA